MTIPSSPIHPPLRLGLIGPRGFGAFCIGAYHDAMAARVIAFAGRDPAALAAAAAQYGVPSTYTDWREMLQNPDIEAVHIVTPPDRHADMAIAALNAGKAVLCEKPFTVNAKELESVVAVKFSTLAIFCIEKTASAVRISSLAGSLYAV